ncbi:hypothetical protein O6H91_11G080800 [Diphasiastrum complanatum]|uniref:Uncharacterized protein n=2 Tax=Diphasiastrum complanatum TaxID=34168 RepID=A0ACC2CB81_DIPCM|nr:hypothetical protein O6H91_11G080200 [Diphasiastrum complanatum]KAJ7539195.1 hypothetical protein O6H91_11G080800 [Diphasiastrum complanatum]
MAFMSRLGSALRQAGRRSDPLRLRGADAVGALSMPAVYVVSRGMASSKLFVGGLSWGADENTLREAFSSYGEVIDVRIITDRDTGRSRGFGFVSFTNNEDAESALQAMDGRNVAGRTIRVDYAVQKPGFGRGLGGGPGGGLGGGFGGGFGGGLGGLGGGNVKRDEFGFVIKENNESTLNADGNITESFGSNDGETDTFGSTTGSWKNL